MSTHTCIICHTSFESSFDLSIHFNACLEKDSRKAFGRFRATHYKRPLLSDAKVDAAEPSTAKVDAPEHSTAENSTETNRDDLDDFDMAGIELIHLLDSYKMPRRCQRELINFLNKRVLQNPDNGGFLYMRTLKSPDTYKRMIKKNPKLAN